MKNVLVLGAGISGLGAAHVLLRHECNVIVSDLKDNIKSVIINCGITNIPHGAFTDYTNLTSISLPNSIERIESAFHGCSKLADVSIPNSCKYLARWALDGTKCCLLYTSPSPRDRG